MAEMRIDNAQRTEQVARMQEMEASGECYFCTGYQKKPTGQPIYIGSNWFIKPNDYPYNGSVHHYLIISKDHLVRIDEILPGGWAELQRTIIWLEKQLGVKGSSLVGSALVLRSGDMAYTAATLDHIHFHFFVGVEKVGTEKNKLEDMILAPVGHKKKE